MLQTFHGTVKLNFCPLMLEVVLFEQGTDTCRLQKLTRRLQSIALPTSGTTTSGSRHGLSRCGTADGPEQKELLPHHPLDSLDLAPQFGESGRARHHELRGAGNRRRAPAATRPRTRPAVTVGARSPALVPRQKEPACECSLRLLCQPTTPICLARSLAIDSRLSAAYDKHIRMQCAGR
jgi:hypothetical protein